MTSESRIKKKSAYSEKQIDVYFNYIGLPRQYRRNASPRLDLDYLQAIQQHHLSRIPFEGVHLHYDPSRTISIDPQDIYDKFIVRGHGGYCFEQNCFLSNVLLGLGFDLYTTGCRVQKRQDGLPTGSWYGWVHMVSLVKIAGNRYVIDVGYGGDQSIEPVLLTDNLPTFNIGKQEKRLIRGTLDFLTEPDQQLWIYQTRNRVGQPWNSCYAFAEIEYCPQDYEVMNLYASKGDGSYMIHNLVAVKMLMEEGRIYGKLILHNADLKRNTGGRTELLLTCKEEAERIRVMEQYFGIVLNETERNAIKGTKIEIQSL